MLEMAKTLEYEEIAVGQTAQFSAEITQEQIDAFAQITADYSPLHTDDQFAKGVGYARKVAHGMFTASHISTLAGMYLPGKYCVLLSTSVKFSRPVYARDKLQIKGTVVEKIDAFKCVKVKVVVKNQRDEKVLSGSYLAKVNADENVEAMK
jgi:acyl dehydratase